MAEKHAIYYDPGIAKVKTVANVTKASDCCSACFRHNQQLDNISGVHALAGDSADQLCNMWTWCGPGGRCRLLAVAAPAWTNMIAGDCVLLLLHSPDTGLDRSTSPRLNGQHMSNSSDLPYWTGAHPALL